MSEQLLQSSILVVFLWLVLGGLGVPLPEDIAVISTGVLIERGLVNPVVGISVLFIGVLGGDAALFFLARRLGPAAYDNRLIKRALPPERRAKIEDAYEKKGGRLVFFARHVAGLRGAVFAMAGIHRMDPKRFLFWDGLAACISIPFSVALGYFGSAHVDRIRADEAKVEHYILLIAAFALLGHLTWRNVHKFRTPIPHRRGTTVAATWDMPMLESILVPVDGSPPSLAALEHACALAEGYGGTVEVLTVIPPTDPLSPDARAENERALDAALVRAHDLLGNRVTRETAVGDPLQEIIERSQEGPDLIVIGTHGRIGRLHSMLGSTAEGVVRNASCPVLTVRDTSEGYQGFAEKRHHRAAIGDEQPAHHH